MKMANYRNKGPFFRSQFNDNDRLKSLISRRIGMLYPDSTSFPA
jgi:hypothetical protein